MKTSSIISKITRTINIYKLFKNRDKVLIALSGGPDSVCLLDILFKLKTQYNFSLYLAHLNHKIRKEAVQDELFVKKLADKYKLPIIIETIDVLKLAYKKNLEDTAREIRYDFLFKSAEKLKANKIALAHTKDDNVETILMHFFRGSGTKGLTGIMPIKDKIIRPLIEISKTEILNYLKQSNIPFRNDLSNQNTKFLRNKIRLKLLPLLKKEYNPNLENLLIENTDILIKENQFLDDYTNKIIKKVLKLREKNKIVLDLNKFIKYDIIFKRRIILKLLKFFIKNNIELKHINSILKISELKKNAYCDLPQGIKVKKIYDELIICKKEIKEKFSYKYPIKIDGETILENIGLKVFTSICKKEDFKKNNNIAELDFKKIDLPIFIRNRRTGDIFSPLGMNGRKKLKDFFIDQKINPEERNNIPLIVSNKDEILWVVGLRISEKVKVNENTIKIIKINVQKI